VGPRSHPELDDEYRWVDKEDRDKESVYSDER
jgi:hypothetical protein